MTDSACTPASSAASSQQMLFAALSAFLLMIVLVVLSPKDFRYDETYHMEAASRVSKMGWSAALISPDNQSAAGPLYSAIHLMAAPFTHLRPPAIRWLNLVLLVLLVLSLSMGLPGGITEVNVLSASSILAVPFLWPTIGLALTEIPALAAFTIFVSLFVRSLQESPSSMLASSVLAVGSGVALGIAILGRQTYLVVIPCVGLMTLWLHQRWYLPALCVFIAILTSAWVFLLWGGVVPPSQQHVDAGLRLDHGILSLAYLGVASLFLKPDWLRPKGRPILIAVIAASVTFFAMSYSHLPARSLLILIFGESFGSIVGLILSAAMIVIGILWLCNTIARAWEERHDKIRVFLYSNLFALAISPVLVSHLFSSRYVVGLLGVLVLVTSQQEKFSYWQVTRLLSGSLCGAATLATYYW